jgi:hypothetical protein
MPVIIHGAHTTRSDLLVWACREVRRRLPCCRLRSAGCPDAPRAVGRPLHVQRDQLGR